jgi:hypothetical protein
VHTLRIKVPYVGSAPIQIVVDDVNREINIEFCIKNVLNRQVIFSGKACTPPA